MPKDKQTFEEWLAKVNGVLESRIGIGTSDLPDIAYTDLYEDGVTPQAAAKKAIEYAGGVDIW